MLLNERKIGLICILTLISCLYTHFYEKKRSDYL